MEHDALSLAKWIYADVKEVMRQRDVQYRAREELVVDVFLGSIPRTFKEAYWGEILYYLCMCSVKQAHDLNSLLGKMLDNPDMDPMSRNEFVESSMFDWIFTEAFLRQDIHEDGIMDAAQLRTLAMYVCFVGQLDVCESTLDTALSTVTEDFDCQRAITWFKSHVYGGYSWMDKDGT